MSATFDLQHGQVTGEAEYRPVRQEAQISFTLPAHFTISSVSGGLASVDRDPANAETSIIRVRPTGQRNRATIRIAYRGTTTASPTLFLESLESGWYPRPDTVHGPYTVDADIAGIPAETTLLSQGVVRRSGTRVRIRQDRPDYDILLVGAAGLQGMDEGEVRFFSTAPQSQANRSFRRHADSARIFVERWFGRAPRPLRLVSLDSDRPGGFYRPGIAVVRERRTPPAPDLYEAEVAYLIAHEFAHQWWPEFGLITGEKWLAESIATHIGLRFVEAAIGARERDAFLALFREHMPADTGPVLAGPAQEASNPAIYMKGPLLLHRLEKQIGREGFDRLLRQVARDEVRSTAGFIDRVREVGGEAVARQFAEDLRNPGNPPVR